jgi:hypothetical protein
VKSKKEFEVLKFNKEVTYNSMRLQTFLMINSQRARKDQIRNERDLITFEWDNKKVEGPKLTKKQMLNFQKTKLGIVYNGRNVK